MWICGGNSCYHVTDNREPVWKGQQVTKSVRNACSFVQPNYAIYYLRNVMLLGQVQMLSLEGSTQTLDRLS